MSLFKTKLTKLLVNSHPFSQTADVSYGTEYLALTIVVLVLVLVGVLRIRTDRYQMRLTIE